jgi:hypothetical protein
MSVHLSTSNSDIHLRERWVPHGAWFKVLSFALAALVLFVVVMEWQLARHGVRPTVVDSSGRWLKSREQASKLGGDGLILIGASRMQLDVDMPIMSSLLGRSAVQLSIDGSSFVPVLRDLASDPSITGTVLVEYEDQMLGDLSVVDRAAQYEALWEIERGKVKVPDFAMIEDWLADLLHTHMRSYADGARPLTSLVHRVLFPDSRGQYIETLPDRSRLADYSKVEMPAMYYRRVMRNMGLVDVPQFRGWPELDEELRRRIAGISAADLPLFSENARIVGSMAKAIETRGGHVVFIRMPTSGLVREFDQQHFPRGQFWERFIRDAGVNAINFEDEPSLGGFNCPDGSHLDYRDRERFTRSLGIVVKHAVGA